LPASAAVSPLASVASDAGDSSCGSEEEDEGDDAEVVTEEDEGDDAEAVGDGASPDPDSMKNTPTWTIAMPAHHCALTTSLNASTPRRP
jgi:hypothetical protein